MPTNSKEYMREYMRTVINNKLKRHCECCNKYIVYLSWYKHLKTKRHVKNFELKNLVKE